MILAGVELLRQRQAADLSQRALAEKLNVHQAQIHRWETGKLNIAEKDIIRVNEYFESLAEVKLYHGDRLLQRLKATGCRLYR